MNVQIFKPNAKCAGIAANFQISCKPDKEPVFFINAILQSSWNEQTRTGSFKENQKNPKKTIALKFNELELGEMIHTFRTGLPYTTYHKGQNSNTGITLAIFKKIRYNGKPHQHETTSFGFSFIRDGVDSFKVPIEAGEAVRLTALFYKFFDVLDAYRQNKFDNYNAPKQNNQEQEEESSPQGGQNNEDDDGPGF